MQPVKPYSFHKLSEYVGGEKNEIINMITLFIDTIPLETNQLQELASKKDWQSIYKIAHKIKPSFDVFAMDELVADITSIELLSHNNNSNGNLVYVINKFIKKFDAIILLLAVEAKK